MKTVNTGPPGNKKPSSLFKVVINNGNRSRIMTISRGRTTLPNLRYRNAHETTAHLEVVMLSGTTITIDTAKFEDEITNIADIPVVNIEDVVNTDGKMYVEGYLKQPFAKVTAYGGIHGGGVIVSEKFKLQIKVIRYDERKEFKKGCFLRILGRVTLHAEGAPILTVQSTEDITLMDKTTPLTEKDLRTKGFQTPKRKHEGSTDECSNKRSPFDS
ncbi:uncharacterized protein LOC130673897 [Microplitis mediator]|uniref:uncharacterized protein LOC130673897 n=1 Tax=Microplitis mediator TaxID=375433 RepID=UPI002556E32F|nr:uncharacterized protein LOC130673897 [Microplitis mediator]